MTHPIWPIGCLNPSTCTTGDGCSFYECSHAWARASLAETAATLDPDAQASALVVPPKPSDATVEAVARAICLARGDDIDMWIYCADEARAAIAAMPRPVVTDAMIKRAREAYANSTGLTLEDDWRAALVAALEANPLPVEARDRRQTEVADWIGRAFGIETTKRLDERAARVLEEAAELAQALGVTRHTADKVIAYVYARPPGEPFQEAGGVGITLLGCCAAIGISADNAEAAELARVLAMPVARFQKRQAEKRAALQTPGIRSDDTQGAA